MSTIIYIESLREKGNENKNMVDIAEEIKEQHNKSFSFISLCITNLFIMS